MIGVDDNRRAEEDRAEAGVAIGEVVDILPMGVAPVLEGDLEVDNTSFHRFYKSLYDGKGEKKVKLKLNSLKVIRLTGVGHAN